MSRVWTVPRDAEVIARQRWSVSEPWPVPASRTWIGKVGDVWMSSRETIVAASVG